MEKNESLLSVMVDVGIAIYGGGQPYHRLRVAKRNCKQGTSAYRAFETLLKQDVTYLRIAADKSLQVKQSTE